ncbi:MAG: glutamate--tRNA ligase [Candidatus Gastranaerophilales bacterium]|nr:glutamate--tRNA ligase [Candidatus Gastranaerophilales bacterium]
MTNNDIRVRIAPSPTGNLHVGTARTALFNYLFAKNMGGKFILRIEDTDIERSKEEYTQNIYDSLKAMGLQWDEGPDVGGKYGPYKQSDRLDLYNEFAQKLVASGHAYEGWCTQEELEAEKEIAQVEKNPYVYSKKCLTATPEQIETYKKEDRKPILRFKVPDKKVQFNDLVKGNLEFDTSLIGDFAIMKSNGTPTYNFAVVVDDIQMKMSHIIRGEDHISNTARQILIYEAFGAKIPEFAHVGMILAPDRSKLSKRHGATAVSEFIQQGYLPEAFVNFITLLGWSPADGEEIKPLDDIIKAFSIDRISSSPAVFEFDKLNWMNGQYIRHMDVKELTQRVKPYLTKYDLSQYSEEQLNYLVEIVREPLTVLGDITDSVSYFFGENVNIDDEIKSTVIDTPETQQVLPKFIELCETLDFSNVEKIHEQLDEFRQAMKPLKPKQTMWAIRAALTGLTRGADIGSVIYLLGKERVISRVQKAIK